MNSLAVLKPRSLGILVLATYLHIYLHIVNAAHNSSWRELDKKLRLRRGEEKSERGNTKNVHKRTRKNNRTLGAIFRRVLKKKQKKK